MKEDKDRAVNEVKEPLAATMRKEFPTWFDLLIFIGIFFVSNVVVSLMAGIVKFFAAEEGVQIVHVVYGLSMLLTLCGTAVWRRIRGGRGRIVDFSRRGFNPVMLLWGVALVFVAGIVVEPLLELFPAEYMEAVEKRVGRGGMAVLTTVVLAPLLEELIFRGYILGSVRRKSGTVWAIVISSAMFGIIHLVPQQVIYGFVIGLILGYIYVRTESIFSVIILHAVNNAVSYTLMGVTESQVTLRELIGSDVLYWIVYAVAVVLFVLSFWMISRSLRGKPAVEEEQPEGRGE